LRTPRPAWRSSFAVRKTSCRVTCLLNCLDNSRKTTRAISSSETPALPWRRQHSRPATATFVAAVGIAGASVLLRLFGKTAALGSSRGNLRTFATCRFIRGTPRERAVAGACAPAGGYGLLTMPPGAAALQHSSACCLPPLSPQPLVGGVGFTPLISPGGGAMPRYHLAYAARHLRFYLKLYGIGRGRCALILLCFCACAGRLGADADRGSPGTTGCRPTCYYLPLPRKNNAKLLYLPAPPPRTLLDLMPVLWRNAQHIPPLNSIAGCLLLGVLFSKHQRSGASMARQRRSRHMRLRRQACRPSAAPPF